MYYFRITLRLTKHKDHDWEYFISSNSKDFDIDKLLSELSSKINSPLKAVSIDSITEKEYYDMKSKK